MKNVVIKWNGDEELRLKATVEQIVNAWEDFAYSYDIRDEACESICDILDEVGIDYSIEEEEDL